MEQRANQFNKRIVIDVSKQKLSLYYSHKLHPIETYPISTGKNGIGSLEGTGKTPLGKHFIAERIGGNSLINSVFIARKPTGEIYSPDLAKQFPNRDWILSRILWLAGHEEAINKGHNKLGCCDTYLRYIYIHGTPDTEPMGKPMSHGCIRMRNTDIIKLFELVDVGTEVMILS